MFNLKFKAFASIILCLAALFTPVCYNAAAEETEATTEKNTARSFIKWVEFDVTSSALNDAMLLDINSANEKVHINWIELLSVYAARKGGNFSGYKTKDLKALAQKIKEGAETSSLTSNQKLYNYYKEAYGAVLGGMLGYYDLEKRGADGTVEREHRYGLIAYSPIASGYYYSDFDDFGVSRSYGFSRPHKGHDLMGSVGTPIIAVEGGYVEACGWNQYGGWRIGIRSFDGKRYYYYAHLRKNHPYNNIYEGKMVDAGEVIGYMGMTGYSAKENVNNIDTPHLHFGMQLIFDPSQKDCNSEIWIDVYAITKFLYRNRAPVYKDAEKGEYYSKSVSVAEGTPD